MDDTTDDTSSTGTGTSPSDSSSPWSVAASRNPVLAAAEIYFMACPWERLPWRDLLQMSPRPEEVFARPPPPPEGWAARRTRRRRSGSVPTAAAASTLTESKEPRRMDSPTTPLSWTTAAASSGSGGYEAARDDDAVTTTAAAAVAGAAGTKRPRRSHAETAAASAGGGAAAVSSSSAFAAAGAAAAATGRSVLGLTTDAPAGTTTHANVATGSGGGAAGHASVSKTTRLLLGKKMTLVELKCYEQSLLQKNTEMRRELELQRKAQKVLLEENARLKMLKSKHQPQAARQLFVAAKAEAASSGKCPFLPFDLNMPAAEDAVDPGERFQFHYK